MRFRSIIIVNAVLILLFIVANYAVWDMVNSNTHLSNTVMNPINVIESMWGDVVDGKVERIDGLNIMPNFPFWLFFVAIAVNLYFINILSKSDKTIKN
jgi:hypothetical protein